jgi:lysophospholipase L1-like esterase
MGRVGANLGLATLRAGQHDSRVRSCGVISMPFGTPKIQDGRGSPSRSTRLGGLRRLYPKILLAVFSLSLAGAISECAVRIFVSEVNDTFIVPIDSIHEKYHHKLLAPPIPASRRDAVRIMFVGDSFTWGMGVRERATSAFPVLVGKFFSQGSVEGVAPRVVQTFNLGMVSYSPSIYGVVLRDYAPLLKPDIVVLSLDDSDPQDDLLYSHLVKTDDRGLPQSVYPGLPGVPDLLIPVAKQIKLVRLVSGIFGRVVNKLRSKSDTLRQIENRYGHYRPGPGTDEEWAEAFQRSLRLTDAIHRYCRENQIKLVIINYPYAPAVTTKYRTTWEGDTFNFTPGVILDPTFHKAVRDFTAARGIPYYDFTGHLRSLPELDGIFNDENGHYAEKGYELLSRELVKFLGPLVDEVAVAKADGGSPGDRSLPGTRPIE